MADELTIKVKAKLDEGSVSEMQSQLDGIGKDKKDGIKLQLDKSITTQINNLKKNLNQLTSKVYPIKIQIDQTAISNIQNLTDSLNKAVANVQKNVSRISDIQNTSGSYNSGKLLSGAYIGQTSYSKTIKESPKGVEDIKEVEKYNTALGEQLTIIRDLQSAEKEETKISTINYEAQAKARKKAAEEEQNEIAKAQELAYKSQQKWEGQLKKAADDRVKEQAKNQEKVQNYLTQQENSYKNLSSLAFKQYGFDKDSPYGKNALEAIEKYNNEIQKVQGDNSLYNKDSRKRIEDARQEAQRVIKEQKALRDEERKQEAQDAKLEADQQKKIQAKQKQFDKIAEQGRKEEEQRQKKQADEVAKGQEYAYKSQQNWESQLKKAAEDRLKQEAAEKKAANQSYLSDLKKNSKQLEYEQKTSANAQNLITNAQNELKLLEKSTFSGSKALTGDYANRARAEIEKVSGEFGKLKEAADKSFSDAMNVSKDGLTASLKNLEAELDRLKGLQYPADKLAAKDVDTLKLDYGNKIQEFKDQLKGAGLETSDFATKLGNLEKSLQTVGKVDGSGTVWANWKAQFESLQASYEKFQASASGKGLKLAESIDVKQLGQIQDLIATLNNSTLTGAGTEALKEELYSLSTEYNNLITQLQSGNLTNDQFTALSNSAKELDDRLKQAANSAKVFQDGFKNEQSLHKFQNNVEGLRNNFEKLERTYADIIEKNPEIAAKFEQLRAMFEQGQVDPINYAQVASDIFNLGKACSNAAGEASGLRGALEGAFGGVGQYLARFTSAFYIINKSIQTIKSMVNEVTELDTSLMELQKVTTLSGDSLAQFTDNAYKTGKEVGRTGKDVIDAVTTFSRAGYNLEESNELAKAALTMTNVGVDIPNTEAAASDMISILKAFDKQADESMQVIDELYNVANKEPLDFGNITQMLVTAGGTLAQTNTSLEETMGLLTGGFATLRDTSVANG